MKKRISIGYPFFREEIVWCKFPKGIHEPVLEFHTVRYGGILRYQKNERVQHRLYQLGWYHRYLGPSRD